MGTPPARITAADFVTPPELARWPLAAEGSGRIGGVRLTLAATAAGTRLAECYQQIPLRVLPPFRFGPDEPALLYLLNPTAGLLDGDAHLMHLHAGAGTRAVVVSQSATRIHPAVVGYCTQHWKIRVDAGAVLVVLPGPAIPFADCRYFQHIAVDLAPGAGFIWGDIWLAGRYARGLQSEQFRFGNLLQELTVRRQGRLVFRDRFCWKGPWDADAADFHFGGAPACGNLFVSGHVPEAALAMTPAPSHAVLPTAAGDSCIRCHGMGEILCAWVVQAALRAASALAGKDATFPWLLSGGDLGPNHWFSLPAAQLK